MAPRKQFILSSHWSEEKHGAWDASKEVETEIRGAKQRGVWRTIGEEGVFDFEEYEDVSLCERVVEHNADADEPFADVAFDRKKEAMQSAAMASQARARDSVAVKGPELSMESLLALVTSTASSSNRPEAGSSGSKDVAQEASDGGSTAESEADSDLEQPSAGLALLAPPSAKAKSAASTAKAAAKTARIKSPGARKRGAAASGGGTSLG